jgi:lysosomal Pro-X carboxypeptidase
MYPANQIIFPVFILAVLWSLAQAGPDLTSCSVRYYDQTLDHFSFASPPQPTFKQRYVVCDDNWALHADASRGPIFFYFGNEADVFLYVNHTGLMWENAAAMGAAMVFAEHRYYGQSVPFPDGTAGCLRWLTTDQALADYAQLIRHFKEARRSIRFIAIF